MRKGIELPKETINALLSGASMFVVPFKKEAFNKSEKDNEKLYESYVHRLQYGQKHFIQDYSRLQISNSFYVQEEFCLTPKSKYCNIILKNDCGAKFIQAGTNIDWCEASKMTYKQSRLKDLVVVDIKIKKVQELSVQEKQNICIIERNEVISFADWIKKQNINYDDNPYVFLITCNKIVAN